MISETVEVRGHLIDSGVLSRVLDDILEYGGDYTIDRFEVGKNPVDESFAQLTVKSEDAGELSRLVMRLQTHGVNLANPGEVLLRTVEQDGVFPDDFYSTTNLETVVRLGGQWVPVENPEMDCGILVVGGNADGARARTIAVSDVRRGDTVIGGASGVKVVPLPAIDRSIGGFEFMNSEVSSEKPQALLVRQIAQQMRDVKEEGKKILWVGGPAVVHTGAAPAMVALVEAGYVDVLFAGNALATHDIEASLYGTSLGVDLQQGRGVEHGHEHHIRAINQIRKAGSIAAAVESGLLSSGVMHSLVTQGKEFILVGSVRDDGPLPDVYTDVIEGQRAMRAGLSNVGFAIMVATMLHSVATGNILPASIPLVCVDINPATVTKLADRGSAQARGIVTDIGLFLEQLALELAPSYRRGERHGEEL
ncbi:MAG: ornithine cyclodeaminase, nickel-pincer nucleotide-dependent [Actinomycetes bacterium]